MVNSIKWAGVILVAVLLSLTPVVSAQGGLVLRDHIQAADISPDGALIALGGEQGVWIYETGNLEAEPRLLSGHTRPVEHVAFGPDSRLLASSAASPEDTIYLWNPVTGEQLAALYPSDPDTPQEDHPTALDFSDNFLVSGHQSGYIWFWNVNPDLTKVGTPISVFHADSAVVDLDIGWLDLVTIHAPRQLYIWGADGAIKLNLPSSLGGSAPLPLIEDGAHLTYDLLLSRMDGIGELAEAIHQHGGTTAALCMSPDPLLNLLDFALGGSDGSVSLFELGHKTALGSWQASDVEITTLAYDGSCQRLLTLDGAGQVALWDVPAQTAIAFQTAG